jgi:putative effector of murein hydrolase LrgA (UPF0299 family)
MPIKIAILVSLVEALLLNWIFGLWVGKLGRWSILGIFFIIMPATIGLLAADRGAKYVSAHDGWLPLLIIIIGIVLLVGGMARKLPAIKQKPEVSS